MSTNPYSSKTYTVSGILLYDKYNNTITLFRGTKCGVYNLLAGKIEYGESCAKAASREAKEESYNTVKISEKKLNNCKNVFIKYGQGLMKCYLVYIKYNIIDYFIKLNIHKFIDDDNFYLETDYCSTFNLNSFDSMQIIKNHTIVKNTNGDDCKIAKRAINILKKFNLIY